MKINSLSIGKVIVDFGALILIWPFTPFLRNLIAKYVIIIEGKKIMVIVILEKPNSLLETNNEITQILNKIG